MKDFVINNELIGEWNFEKNNELGFYPDKLTLGSNKKVWWICNFGHEWDATISSRYYERCGCPICAKEFKVSSQEMKLYYYIKKYFSDAISGFSDKANGLCELDVYIPCLNVGVEYDGDKWHQNIDKDYKKDAVCKNMGITLFRIREPKCPIYESNCTFVNLNNLSQHELENAIGDILRYLGVNNSDIDFDRDLSEIESLTFHIRKDNSLAELYPDIAAEWHQTKNGTLRPESVSYSSDKRAWWKCLRCGYEWATMVSTRTRSDKCGCPRCGREKTRKAKCQSVYCVELDMEFESGRHASNTTNVSHHGILDCAKGKQEYAGKHPVTGEKLHWKFTNLTVQN